MRLNSVTYETVPIDTLKPYPGVLRRHSRRQLAKLRRSLEHFGQARAIIVTSDRMIVDGHAVWEAMRSRGATEVYVARLHALDEGQIRALRLQLNRSAEDARWNRAELKAEFLTLEEIDVDLDLTGFEIAEIDNLLRVDLPDAHVLDDADAMPGIETAAVTAPGRIWALGPHRISCGDARDLALVAKILEGQQACLAIVDPPSDGLKNESRTSSAQKLSNITPSLDLQFQFLRDVFAACRANLSTDGTIYAFATWSDVTTLNVAAHAALLRLKDLCVWSKDTPTPRRSASALYRDAHELISVFADSDIPHRNAATKRFSRDRSNVWSYARVSERAIDPKLRNQVGRQKPVAMIADIMRDVTARQGVVLDTFLGLGATLMAAEEAGRVCCAIDVNPLFVDAAIRRWQNATGSDAVLLGSDQPFNETARRLLAAGSTS